jgi:hypothetical protein
MTLRLNPQNKTRLANATFLAAFLFSIFTVSYLSGQAPGRLPCPARPNGTGQRAEAARSQDEDEQAAYMHSAQVYEARQSPVSQAKDRQSSNEVVTNTTADQQRVEQAQAPPPQFMSISARLAYYVAKLRQSSG